MQVRGYIVFYLKMVQNAKKKEIDKALFAHKNAICEIQH